MLALVLGLVFAIGSARAETPAERRTADVLVAEAHDRMAAGDTAGAVKRLASAYAVVPDPQIGLELGQALAKHGDLERAIAVLRETATAPARGQKAKAAAKRAAAELALLERKLAWLRVQVEAPAGTTPTVSVDGRPARAGTWIPQKPGKHRIEAAAPGLPPAERELELAAGAKETLALKLEPPPPPATTGTLVVSAAGGGAADLFVDDKRVGALPYRGELAPGEYRIRAEGQGVRSAEQTVKVTLGQELSVTLTLAQAAGVVRVTTPYPNASIYVDGELVGRGKLETQLPEGKHDVTITLDGFYPETRSIVATASQPTLVAISRLVAVADAGEPAPEPYRGSYVRLGPALLVGAHAASDTLSQDCLPPATCDTKSPLGLGLRVGVGWSFGVIGAEYFMLGVVDRWTATVKSPATDPFPRQDDYTFFRYGGAAGLTLRATNRGETFRVSGGLGGGLAIRAAQLQRTTEHDTPGVTSDDVTGKASLFFAPALTADLGVLIGSTPGVKFHAGVLAYAELTPLATPSSEAIDDPASATPALDYVTKPQFFLGPTIGAQFGR